MKVFFTTDAIETTWHDEFKLKEIIFAETRKMSPHLLSFVVTDYSYRGYEKINNDGIKLRTFHGTSWDFREGAVKDANFTNISTDILELSINAVNGFAGSISIFSENIAGQTVSQNALLWNRVERILQSKLH